MNRHIFLPVLAAFALVLSGVTGLVAERAGRVEGSRQTLPRQGGLTLRLEGVEVCSACRALITRLERAGVRRPSILHFGSRLGVA